MESIPVAAFGSPWSMVFLPDGRLLVSERSSPGRLTVVTQAGIVSTPLDGLPANVGLLDIAISPAFVGDRMIYFSFLEADPAAPRIGRNAGDATLNPAGLALGRAKLTFDGAGVGTLSNVAVIWRQQPKIVALPGSGEPGGRIAFSPDGRFLFLTAGDRQELDPTLLQQLGNTLGKIIRLYPDGSIPADNPYFTRTGALPEIWTWGHRNQYGLAFDATGRLWESEMGPMGGDEFNLVEAGSNYGWPLVSYGDNYVGGPIPKPAAGDGFAMSAATWTPVIAPAGMIFYSGSLFGAWKGDAILSGLQSKGLVRVRLTGTAAAEAQRIDLGARIREVEQGPDGAIWVLEDAPSGGRLLKLTPTF